MHNEQFDFKKMAITFFVIAMIMLFLTLFKQIKISRMEKFQQEQIDMVYQDLEKRIKDSERTIYRLNLENGRQFRNILDYRIKIDSLEQVKGKVEIVYRDRIRSIQGASVNELEKYWQNELK
jgi:hypothetical protein